MLQSKTDKFHLMFICGLQLVLREATAQDIFYPRNRFLK